MQQQELLLGELASRCQLLVEKTEAVEQNARAASQDIDANFLNLGSMLRHLNERVNVVENKQAATEEGFASKHSQLAGSLKQKAEEASVQQLRDGLALAQHRFEELSQNLAVWMERSSDSGLQFGLEELDKRVAADKTSVGLEIEELRQTYSSLRLQLHTSADLAALQALSRRVDAKADATMVDGVALDLKQLSRNIAQLPSSRLLETRLEDFQRRLDEAFAAAQEDAKGCCRAVQECDDDVRSRLDTMTQMHENLAQVASCKVDAATAEEQQKSILAEVATRAKDLSTELHAALEDVRQQVAKMVNVADLESKMGYHLTEFNSMAASLQNAMYEQDIKLRALQDGAIILQFAQRELGEVLPRKADLADLHSLRDDYQDKINIVAAQRMPMRRPPNSLNSPTPYNLRGDGCASDATTCRATFPQVKSPPAGRQSPGSRPLSGRSPK